MIYTQLGRSGYFTSRIAFGCEPLGGTDWGRVDETLAMAAVERAVSLGINLYDTADVYGLGLSEERLARALGSKRHDVVIVTKVGMRWEPNPSGRAPVHRDASPEYIVKAIEASLRRMRLDTIPVCLLHWPDPKTKLEETVDALRGARERGLIRYFGLSNFRNYEVSEQLMRDVCLFEEEYSLVSRDAEARLPAIRSSGAAFLAYGVLAQGLLTGKYGPQVKFDVEDRRHRLPHFSVKELQRRAPLLKCLQDIARERDITIARLATRWVLENDFVAAAIVGAKNPNQVEDTAAASEIVLGTTELARMSAAQDTEFSARAARPSE